ncbi:uroporphyrinogen decarboxylase family protein [Anaerovibrio sp.]|uniref:uroporphyrinogen decarboxylase family protein n=1 Tax=Anaerovibrio sp. TaxID=1872532 RepID=UPI003F17C3EB
MATEALKDQMTAIERMAAYARGEDIDRLPCVPIVGNTAARVIGVKVSDFRGNGELIAKAHIEAYKLFHYDNIRVFTDLYTQAEAMGANVVYPEDETAYLGIPAVELDRKFSNLQEIDELEPADPYKDGNLPEHLKAMEIVVNAVGREVPVGGAVTGPFTNASFLIGAENLVRLTLKNPEAVHKLCQVSLESNLRYVDAVIAAGVTPSLTDAMSSSTVISPRLFREFSLPYLKKLIDHIHGKGKKVTLHICGKTDGIWADMVEAGADCLSIDNDADIAKAKTLVGDRVMLMGNIRPSETMLEGTTEDVHEAVTEVVRRMYDAPKGFIVASGCSLPTETPFANIHEMLNTVRRIGNPFAIHAPSDIPD